jgi:hypothetical protein
MRRVAAVAVSTLTVALVTAGGGAGLAKGGGSSSGTWPAALPLPTSPGRIVAQSSTSAVVRSTDTVAVVKTKLDGLYLTQKGCTRKLAVNRPRDYVCRDSATGRTTEVYFTFAALDPTTSDPSRSQTNAFRVGG